MHKIGPASVFPEKFNLGYRLFSAFSCYSDFDTIKFCGKHRRYSDFSLFQYCDTSI